MGMIYSKMFDDCKSEVMDSKLIEKIGSSSNVAEFTSTLRRRGLLLKNPRNTTPLHARGVCKQWLSVFLALLPECKPWPVLATDLRELRYGWNTTKLVTDVIWGLTSSTERPLYDYIPKSYVKEATVFVSYSWDYEVKKFVGDLPDEGYFWIDFCAVSQHNNSYSKKELDSIGKVVERINNTRLIVDATYKVDGICSYIAKLGHSLTRAWVLYEIANTPKASLNIQFQCTIENKHPGLYKGDEYIPELLKLIAKGKRPNDRRRFWQTGVLIDLNWDVEISLVAPLEDCDCRDKADKDMILAAMKERFGTFEVAHLFIMTALKRAANEKLSRG